MALVMKQGRNVYDVHMESIILYNMMVGTIKVEVSRQFMVKLYCSIGSNKLLLVNEPHSIHMIQWLLIRHKAEN